MKTILKNFHLNDILDNEREWDKLWSKFDLDNVGMVRTNVFLRLLDYRVNLADEINANIQRLVSRSSAAGMIERSLSSSASKKSKRLPVIKPRESPEGDKSTKHSAPPPLPTSTALIEPVAEIRQDSNDKPTTNDNQQSNQIAARELSTKFRTIVQQHRKMIKQLNDTDEFVPFLDRKVMRNLRKDVFIILSFQVNEGYFCLKTVFAYLDPKQIHQINNEQLIVALNQFDIPLSLENIEQFLQK